MASVQVRAASDADDTRPTNSAPVGLALGERMRVPDDWRGIRDWRGRHAQLEEHHGDENDLAGATRR